MNDRDFTPVMKMDARLVLALVGSRRGTVMDDLRRRATETITRESRRVFKIESPDEKGGSA